eukprot:Hpha_TRINITY_DN5060_c0_g1::TRINITY_DN5060_c0_g1_i1::g.94234::m.94234
MDVARLQRALDRLRANEAAAAVPVPARTSSPSPAFCASCDRLRQEVAVAETATHHARQERAALAEWLDKGVAECHRVAAENEQIQGELAEAKKQVREYERHAQSDAVRWANEASRELAPVGDVLRQTSEALSWVEDALLRGDGDALRDLTPLPSLKGEGLLTPQGSPQRRGPSEMCDPYAVRSAAACCVDAAASVVAVAAHAFPAAGRTPGGSAEAAATLLRRTLRAQQEAVELRAQNRMLRGELRRSEEQQATVEPAPAAAALRSALDAAAASGREAELLRARVAELEGENAKLRASCAALRQV